MTVRVNEEIQGNLHKERETRLVKARAYGTSMKSSQLANMDGYLLAFCSRGGKRRGFLARLLGSGSERSFA